jgi:hypothetical protein
MVAGQAQGEQESSTSDRHFVPISRQGKQINAGLLPAKCPFDSGQRIQGKAMAFGVLEEAIRLVLGASGELYAEPVCQFTMLEALPQAERRKAVSGRN